MKALVITTYQPSEALLDLLRSFSPGEFAAVVVVDDGSGPKCADIFQRAVELPGVQVVRHAVHVGRGASLRAGIHAALIAAPDLTAVVTAEAHHTADAIRQVSRDSSALVIGVPFASPRSAITRFATRALIGWPLARPESTLRSIPAALLPHLLRMESRGAEFDIEMLLAADHHSIAIVEEVVEGHGAHPASSWSAVWSLFKGAAMMRPRRPVGFVLALITAAILLAAVVSEVHGFTAGHLFHEPIWMPWGRRRLAHFVGLFAAWSLPVLLMFAWSYASIFVAFATIATVLACGPVAVVALLYFLTSACALGSRLLGKAESRRLEAAVCATLLGIGIYACAMTLTARVPINYPVLWAAALAVPIALDRRGVMRRFRELIAAVRSISLPNWAERGAFALLALVLSIHWFAALEPETSSDGLAMHLAIPINIGAHHAMTFQPSLFLWSVMPMAADFTYSIVYLLGGEAPVSLFNFALLLFIAALIYSTSRRWLAPAPALMVTALFASTPLVHLVTGSLFIENFVAAMILGMLATLWRFHETGRRSLLYASAALAGVAAAAKLGAFLFAIIAAPAVAICIRRAWKNLAARPAVTAALAGGLFLAVAAPPYVIAYAKTGNPTFPFLNATFRSPLLEQGPDFRDFRFHQPLTWKTPFDLTFHSNQYFESQNGAFGFQYLLLIPLALIALLGLRQFAVRSAAFVGLAAGAIIMATQPNARYVYATLPLLSIVFGALLARFTIEHRWMARALLAAAALSICLNIYFAAASGWYHRHFYSVSLFQPHGRDRYLREVAPMRDVAQRFRRAQPRAPVLLVTENDLADAGDHVYEYEWHQYAIWKRIATAPSVADLRDVFTSLGIRYFIAHRPGPDEDPLAPFSLGQFLANCTTPQFENGRFYVGRMTPECESLSGPDLETKLESAPPALVRAGIYDDYDPAMRFRGPWTRSKGFVGPYRNSISYTDVRGAQAAFAFEGNSLTYVYTKAFNRGIAEIEIDGATHRIDLYSAPIQWQSKTEFCCLGSGRHQVVVRVTGDKQPLSQGAYVDLDALIAR